MTIQILIKNKNKPEMLFWTVNIKYSFFDHLFLSIEVEKNFLQK